MGAAVVHPQGAGVSAGKGTARYPTNESPNKEEKAGAAGKGKSGAGVKVGKALFKRIIHLGQGNKGKVQGQARHTGQGVGTGKGARGHTTPAGKAAAEQPKGRARQGKATTRQAGSRQHTTCTQGKARQARAGKAGKAGQHHPARGMQQTWQAGSTRHKGGKGGRQGGRQGKGARHQAGKARARHRQGGKGKGKVRVRATRQGTRRHRGRQRHPGRQAPPPPKAGKGQQGGRGGGQGSQRQAARGGNNRAASTERTTQRNARHCNERPPPTATHHQPYIRQAAGTTFPIWAGR